MIFFLRALTKKCKRKIDTSRCASLVSGFIHYGIISLFLIQNYSIMRKLINTFVKTINNIA